MTKRAAIWGQVEFIRRHHALTAPFLYPPGEREACMQMILKEQWALSDAAREKKPEDTAAPETVA